MSIKNGEGNIDICVLAVYDSERMMGGNIDGIIDGIFGSKEEGSPWPDSQELNHMPILKSGSKTYPGNKVLK